MSPRPLVAAAAVLAGAGALVAIATASPADALDPDAVQTVVVGGSSATLLPLQVDGLYPGVGTHARFVVRRGATWSDGLLALGIAEVEDLERGCNRPERNAGDASCGGGNDQGELSEQLLVNASWSSDVAGCAVAPVPDGQMSMRYAAGRSFTASAAGSAADACLVVALHLPFEADNLVQTDLVRFDLRIGLEDAVPAGLPASPIRGTDAQAAHGSATTGGPAAAQVAALTPRPRALPFTGGQPLLLVGWGALLLFAGRVLVPAARQRRV